MLSDGSSRQRQPDAQRLGVRRGRPEQHAEQQARAGQRDGDLGVGQPAPGQLADQRAHDPLDRAGRVLLERKRCPGPASLPDRSRLVSRVDGHLCHLGDTPGLCLGWPGWRISVQRRAAFELPTPDLLNRADVFSSPVSRDDHISVSKSPAADRIAGETPASEGGSTMPQYLLSIYQPDGDPPPPEVLDPIMAKVRAWDAELQAAGAWVFTGGLHPASTATVVRDRDGEAGHHRRPVRRGQGAPRRVLGHQRPGSGRRAGLGAQAGRGRRTLPIEVRPFQVDAGLTGAVTPSRAREIERVFRDEYGRAVAVLVRVFGDIDLAEEAVQDAFTVAVQRWPGAGMPPSPAGWIITTARNRAIDRLRREASRDDRQAQAAQLHEPPRPTDVTGGGGTRARRPAAADLHLLPPGARHRRPGRADAAAARRADHGGDRARVPGPRADHGPAAGPGQGQDPRRADPVPGTQRGRAARPARRRAGRGLPDLQRGLHGQLRRPADPRRTCAPRRSGSAGCWPS